VAATIAVQNVKQELPTFPEHLRSQPVFSGARAAQSLVSVRCFVVHCFFFCSFYFGNCIVCLSSIYGF